MPPLSPWSRQCMVGTGLLFVALLVVVGAAVLQLSYYHVPMPSRKNVICDPGAKKLVWTRSEGCALRCPMDYVTAMGLTCDRDDELNPRCYKTEEQRCHLYAPQHINLTAFDMDEFE